MKLLILTQKVDLNDDLLGFMHGWIKEFARHCEKVTVICLEKGKYDLPENVKVLSLGKEKGVCKLDYVRKFYKYLWQERNNYDAVFVHMNPEYVVLGGLIWRLLGKKIGLWYAHGYVPFKLRVAEKLARVIFTSTKSGFRIKSRKLKVVGQGTDMSKFYIPTVNDRGVFRIVTVGRISPAKDYETLIRAASLLAASGIKTEIKIVGGPAVEADKRYFEAIKKLAAEEKLGEIMEFAGSVPYIEVPVYLRSADLFVNMSHTGSLDKVMLEAMASGLPVVTCNEAMDEVLGDYRRKLMYRKKDYQALAERIKYIYGLENSERKELGKNMRKIVEANHSLKGLVKKIIEQYRRLEL